VSRSQLISEKSSPPKPLTGRAVKSRRLRTSEVLQLDLRALKRDGFFDTAPGEVWRSRFWLGCDEDAASEAHYCRLDNEQGPMGIAILRPRRPESPRQDNVHGALLTATRPHFGGRRWWFQCPLVVDGVPCRRRCLVLYRPWGAPFFGCRQCHQLTYRSSQTHRAWRDAWDRLLAAGAALDRAADPRCSYRRKARALRRAEKAEPAIAALNKRLAGP
jgi:hypothetical protein